MQLPMKCSQFYSVRIVSNDPEESGSSDSSDKEQMRAQRKTSKSRRADDGAQNMSS